MPVVNKLPNTDVTDPYDAAPSKIGGQPTNWQTLADLTDGTYLQYASAGGSSVGVMVGFGDITLAAGEFVRRARIDIRFDTLSGNPDLYVFFMDAQGRRTAVEDHYTVNLSGGLQTFVGAWHTVGPDGQPWTLASINSAIVRMVDTDNGSTLPAIAEMSVEVETNFSPVVTPQANAVITDTTKPTVNWTYSDADQDPQASYSVKIFTKTQTAAAGFNPETSTPITASGVLNSAATTWQPTSALSNGTTYKAYIKVSDGLSWSAWASTTITLNAESPAVPSMSLTTNSDPPTTAISIASYDNLLTYEASSGGESGVTAFTGSNCVVTHVSGASPLQGNYAARATASSAANFSVTVDDKKIQVTEGLIYSGVASVRPQSSGSPQRSCNVAVKFYDQYGQIITTSTGPDVLEMTNGSGWTQLFVPTAPAPIGAVVASLVVTVKSAGNGEYHDLDCLLVCAGASNLVRNSTGAVDTDANGLGDQWTSYNIGSGTITHSYDETTPLFGDSWSRFDVVNNTNLAGVTQKVSLPGSASGYYGYASCFVYSPNDTTVQLSVYQLGSTEVAVPANTVTPIVVSGLLADQAGTGISNISILTSDQNAEVLWTGVQLGISPTALTYDPQLNVWPNNWTRGGISGVSTHEIQRSDDGEETWIDVRRLDDDAEFSGGLQSYSVTDYEVPPSNVNVVYRARKVYTNSNGIVLSSAWSKYARVPTALQPTTYWLNSTTNAAYNAAFNVEVGLQVDRKEPQSVLKLLGRSNPVVLRGRIAGQSASMKIECVTKAESDAFDALRELGETLWLASPLGDGLYISLGDSAPATVESDTYCEISVDYTEVDRPPVYFDETAPVVPDAVVPTSPPSTPFTGLLNDTTLPSVYAAYSLRALSTAAKTTNKAVTVTRANDHTTSDIGFDGSGNLDTTTLATFCSGTSGVVTKWWDQSGNGFHITNAEANGWTIYASGAFIPPPTGTSSRPSLKATDAARGGLATGLTFTGNKLTAFVVGAIQSTTTSLSPRFLSVANTSLADNDTGKSGIVLVARDGGGTVTQAYREDRGTGAALVTKGGTYNTLQQITSTAWDGVTGGYQITVDGTAGTAATATYGNFNASRLGFGHSGLAVQSVANQYCSEMLLFTTQLSTQQIGTIAVNQSTYYGTGAQTTPPPSTGATLVATDSLASQSTPLPSSEWLVYADGQSTMGAIAWRPGNISVSGGVLTINGTKHASPITITVNGQQKQFLRESGAVFWNGPGGVAKAKKGLWEVDVKADGNTPGWGFVIITWTNDEKTYPWPTGREYDVIEIYAGNATKQGAESNMHYDTVSPSNRHLKAPGSTTNSSAANVAAGSYQTDWTVWHTVGFKMIHGSLLQVFIDGVSVATINGTSYNPVNPDNTLRWGCQVEGYGVSDAASSSSFKVQLKNWRYSSLP